MDIFEKMNQEKQQIEKYAIDLVQEIKFALENDRKVILETAQRFLENVLKEANKIHSAVTKKTDIEERIIKSQIWLDRIHEQFSKWLKTKISEQENYDWGFEGDFPNNSVADSLSNGNQNNESIGEFYGNTKTHFEQNKMNQKDHFGNTKRLDLDKNVTVRKRQQQIFREVDSISELEFNQNHSKMYYKKQFNTVSNSNNEKDQVIQQIRIFKNTKQISKPIVHLVNINQ